MSNSTYVSSDMRMKWSATSRDPFLLGRGSQSSGEVAVLPSIESKEDKYLLDVNLVPPQTSSSFLPPFFFRYSLKENRHFDCFCGISPTGVGVEPLD